MGFFDRHINFVQTLALISTLLFVAYQAHEHTQALEQQEYGALLEQQQQIFALQIEHSDVYVKALLEPQNLSPSELWKVAEIAYLRLELLERFQRENANGIIPISDLRAEYADTQIYLGTPVGRLVWAQARSDYQDSPKFVEEIEKALKQGSIEPDDRYLEELLEALKKNRKE